VSPKQQTLYQFHTGRGASIFFNPEKDNYIWLVTPEQKVAILKAKQLKLDAEQSQKGVDFELQVQNRVIKSEQDLREILQLKK
jgi:hypothetical protein